MPKNEEKLKKKKNSIRFDWYDKPKKKKIKNNEKINTKFDIKIKNN